MKKVIGGIIAAIIALFIVTACVERIPVGYVGVVYSANGVEQETVSQGWKLMSPLKHVATFPISQQRIVFSDDPADYNERDHQDWHIDATANDGIISINLTVNYNFMPDRVVELYSKFNGMSGETLMESYIQNDIIAYTKEVLQRYTVSEIYLENRAEVNTAITEYLNEKLTAEYGINVSSALIIDATPDSSVLEKIQAKAQAKQEAETAELNTKTALAQAETEKAKAQAAADVKVIEAQAEAEVKRIEAEAEAEANKLISESITQELIDMKEAEARLAHGWVTVSGADNVIVDATDGE